MIRLAEKELELKAGETLSWKNSISEEPQNLNHTSATWIKSSKHWDDRFCLKGPCKEGI